MIERHSSRTEHLEQSVLLKALQGAQRYDRIAGYFSSSILEVAGEALESVSGQVRVVCNAQVEAADVATAASALNLEAACNAQHQEWCATEPEKKYLGAVPRLAKLYELLKSGRLAVRVVPNDVFGLVHGKAGVITLADGRQTSFLGSVNETYSGWRLNYELLWEDDSPAAVAWVQREFDYFWQHPLAVPLADFVVEDIGRIVQRTVIGAAGWRQEANPAPAIVEAPVYRQELGLWEHQKAFIQQAFHDHKAMMDAGARGGARYVLADQVGLGKTVQLAMAAQLMALYGEKPVLIIVPKTLVWQWQEEMLSLLAMPSAVWTGRCWQDESGTEYPVTADIRQCPRRVGVISQGIIVRGREEITEQLLRQQYECVIVDEAHRARRQNLGEGKEGDKPQPNKLMRFLLQLSRQTRSMLLATATPVQLYPVEAWDLLYILSQADDSVLGSPFSHWRTEPQRALALIMDKAHITNDYAGFLEQAEWLRDPFPPADEEDQGVRSFEQLRRRLQLPTTVFTVRPETMREMINARTPESRRLGRILEHGFMEHHNPFIRHIVRRTRDALEKSGQLKKIEVRLMGEAAEESIPLYDYLRQAYSLAEQFCEAMNRRVRGGGFVKTMLLRRVGSTMQAGRLTAQKILAWGDDDDAYAEEDDLLEEAADDAISEGVGTKKAGSEFKQLTEEERGCLEQLVQILAAHEADDPKYVLLKRILLEEGFADRGCIVFSQYYDSAFWVAQRLSTEEVLPGASIGLYAGGDKSGIFQAGMFQKHTKEDIKRLVRQHELQLLIGTDAASEGLNLQTLGSLINLDLPWNPTRLEQRKGRIQRIGQINDEIYIYNMRYRDSVEDRVHELLSKRLKNINSIFGQLPDVLKDVWIQVALKNEEDAKKLIDSVPQRNPFELRYNQQAVQHVDWETCTQVLDAAEKYQALRRGWK